MSSVPKPAIKTSPTIALASEPEAATSRAGGIGDWLRSVVPTAAAVIVLAGLAAWGHYSEWTLPKFSALLGGEEAEVADWCEAHNVPESICVECKPSLMPATKDFGWCQAHGVANCPFEHPEIAQLKEPATITPAMLQRAERAIALRPRVQNNSLCNLHKKRIQFESVDAINKVGVDIARVKEAPIVEAIAANGEIVYDETRMAHLSSRVAGTVWRVQKQVGDRVKKGDVLALVDAGDVGRAKSEFLQAVSQLRLKEANVDRLRPLAGSVIPGKQLLEAQSAAEEARIQLHRAQQALANFGLAIEAGELADLSAAEIAKQIQTLGLPTDLQSGFSATNSSNLLPLRSPLEGVVVNRTATEGEVVSTNSPLFDVADTSQLWLNLNVRQEDAKYVSHGQQVLFRASDSANEPDDCGTVNWISTGADDTTRTVKVRVELPNADGRLRANTFGTGRIVLRDEPKAIVVPSEALHWDGQCNVVFVRDKNFNKPDAPKVFYVRSVVPGVKDGATTEIIAGLLPDEVIASKNSVILEAQLLKSNLGAGCGCCEGK